MDGVDIWKSSVGKYTWNVTESHKLFYQSFKSWSYSLKIKIFVLVFYKAYKFYVYLKFITMHAFHLQ